MKTNKTIIRKTLMEQLNFITNLLGIKDPNITIFDVLDAGAHKEIIAKLESTNNLIKVSYQAQRFWLPKL